MISSLFQLKVTESSPVIRHISNAQNITYIDDWLISWFWLKSIENPFHVLEQCNSQKRWTKKQEQKKSTINWLCTTISIWEEETYHDKMIPGKLWCMLVKAK